MTRSLLLALCLAGTPPCLSPAAAQEAPTTAPAHPSPYAGQQGRAITALSEDDIADLRRGGGWGLAKAAGLNGMPGPAHLLEMKDEVGLSPEQVAQIEAIFATMHRDAIAEGERLIAAETELEAAFRDRTVTEDSLKVMIDAAEAGRARLRLIHLATHLSTPALLSEAQIARYNDLRGYGADPCAAVPAGHDPAMWRTHNGCK